MALQIDHASNGMKTMDYFCRAFFVLRSFRFRPINEPTLFPAFGDDKCS